MVKQVFHIVLFLLISGSATAIPQAVQQEAGVHQADSLQEDLKWLRAELEDQRRLLIELLALPKDDQRAVENQLADMRSRVIHASRALARMQHRQSEQGANITNTAGILRDLASQVDVQGQQLAKLREAVQAKDLRVQRLGYGLIAGMAAFAFTFLIVYKGHARSIRLMIGQDGKEFRQEVRGLLAEWSMRTASIGNPSSRVDFESLYPKEIAPFHALADWGDGPRITVTSETLRAMLDSVVVAEQRRPGKESGGALVGRVRCDAHGNWQDVYIEGVLSSGDGAKYEHAYFEEDRAAQEAELERFRALDNRVSYLGDFHSHPGELRHPSGGDLRTDVQNVRDSFARSATGGFVYAILTHDDGICNGPLGQDGWRADFYFMHSRRLEYLPFQPRIVEGAVRPKSWQAPHIPRVRAELSGLRGFADSIKIDHFKRDGDNYLVIDVADSRWSEKRVLFFLAEDYPQVPPTVFLADQKETTPLDSKLISWNPDNGLVNILYRLTDGGQLPS